MLGFDAISTTPIAGELAQATYYYTASGGLSLGGSSIASLTLTYTASGNLALNNTSTVKPTYLYLSSGGLYLGDSSHLQTTYLYSTSGSLSLGSSVDVTLVFNHVSSGGLTLSSSSDVKTTYLYVASGGLSLGNESFVQPTYSYHASGGLNLGDTTTPQFTLQYTTTGGLNLRESSSLQTTYLYTTSGNLSLGDSANLQNYFAYIASGGLSLGNNSTSRLIHPYTAFGGMVLSGSATVQVQSSYYESAASGGLSLGDSATVKVTYLYTASGGFSFSDSAYAQVTYLYLYTASGGLQFSDNANAQFVCTYVASGNLNFGESSSTKNTYLYTCIGGINLGGVAGVTPPPPSNFSYAASGGLNIEISSEVVFTEFRPKPGYWEAIKDEIQRMRELGLICNDPISEYVFIRQLQNNRIRQLIESATTWHVICYLGNGVFDIQVDGVRMSVSTNIQILPTEIQIPVVQKNDVISFKQNVETFLPNNVVLDKLRNDKVRTMLLSPNIASWVSKIENGKIRIIITTIGNDILSLLVDPNTIVITPEVVSSPVSNLNGTDIRQKDLTQIPNDIILARLQNDRVKSMLSSPNIRSWFAVVGEGGKINITATTIGDDIIHLSVNLDNSVVRPTVTTPSVSRGGYTPPVPMTTVSQDAALTIFGPSSFLSRIPRSDWRVLGFRGNKLEIQLKNGLVMSR